MRLLAYVDRPSAALGRHQHRPGGTAPVSAVEDSDQVGNAGFVGSKRAVDLIEQREQVTTPKVGGGCAAARFAADNANRGRR
jgi:hypothetical protein